MAITFVTDPNNFLSPRDSTADSVSWDRFPDRLPLDFKGSPTFNGKTDSKDRRYSIAIKGSHLARRTQDGGPSWVGSFNAGDALLFTDFSPGPLQFLFARPIRGAGAQINIKDPVEHVTFGIGAFAGDTRVDIPNGGTIAGSISNSGDGSASFLGVLDSPGVALITRIVFFLTVLDHGYRGDGSFAINTLRLAL